MSAAPTPVATPAPSLPLPPPPLSGDRETVRSMLALGRTLALVFALLAGLLFLVLLVLGIVEAVFGAVPADLGGAVYCLVGALVNYLAWREIPRLEQLAQSGEYRALRDQLLLWFILGLLFFVVVGVVLLVAWIKVDSLVPSAGPAPPSGPPVTGGACPRCGNPATWLPEYHRFYCYHCSAYL